MYQINCRILDGKNDRIDDCGGQYTRIISSEHNTEIINADHANKMDALTEGEHAQAHAQKHISVTTVTIAPRRASPSPMGQSHAPPAGLGAPLPQLDRPGDSALDVVQPTRSTIVIPSPRKVTPFQVSSNSNLVCRQTDRSLEDVDRNVRPVFVEKLKSLSVEEGQCTRLSCQVKGQPMPSVHWEKDGRQVTEENLKLTSIGDTFSLEITETTIADAGRYVCVATNSIGEARSMASLMVQKGQGLGSKFGQIDLKSALHNRTHLKTYNLQSMEQIQQRTTDFRSVLKKQHSDVRTKPTATFRQLDYSSVEGATVSLSCHTAGYPEPKITWFKESQLVEQSETVTVTCESGVSTLKLNDVTEDGSAGAYTCQVENELGRSSATCRLFIQGSSHEMESTKQPPNQHSSSSVNDVLTNNDNSQDDGKNSPTEITVNHLLNYNDNEKESIQSPKVAKMSNESEGHTFKEDKETSSPVDDRSPTKLSEPSPKLSEPSPKLSEPSPKLSEPSSKLSESSPKLSEPSPKLSEPSSKLPESSPKLSEPSPKLSEPSSKLSEPSPKLSEPSYKLSEPSPKLSEPSPKLSEPSSKLSEPSPKLSEPSPKLSEPSSKLPESSPKLSEPSPKLSEPSSKLPESSPKLSEPSPKLSEPSSKLPELSPKLSEPYPINSPTQSKHSQASTKNPSTHSQPEFPGTGKTDSSTAQVGSVAIDDEDDDAFEPETTDDLSTSVDEPPLIEDLQPENIHICCGSDVHLVARFSGHPLPQMKWIKGTELLAQDERIRFETKPRFAELMILNAQPQDTGTYTFVITNEFGEDKQLSSVTVEDKPDPPVGRPAVTSILDNSVVLSWSGSSYDGGCSVIKYRVEISQRQTDNWEVITDNCQHTTYQVNHLVANTEYVFRVSAANKHGFSQPGDISDSIVTNGLKVSSTNTTSASDDFPFTPRVVTIDKDKKFTDSYVLGEEIGKGKFGSVFKCTEKITDRLFAAKFIRVKAGQRDEFRKEIEIMNELHHPKLLLLWDSFESAREIILVMEHVSGGELMERIINDDYVLTERECIHFMRQICDGVQYMHSSDILHLDLKPENILCITPNSNEIKIIDFGLARKFDPSKEFKVLFGTAEFVAPEVINYDAISYKTDMWSVGVICYVLLSGLSPFLGNNDKETLVNVTKALFDFDDEAFDEISDDAKDFISKLLVKDQRKRMWVEDSLRHPWMAQDVTYMRAKKLSTVKHKKFMARNKWQKTGNALVALRRMVGLQRMSSGLMDSCRSPLSSSSQGDAQSLLGDSLSTISESDDSGFRSAQTDSTVDFKCVLGTSKDVDGIVDLKIDEIVGEGESQKDDDSVANCEGRLLQGERNGGSGLSEVCVPVRNGSLECSDKLELSDVVESLEVEKSEVGGESDVLVGTICLEVEKKSENCDQSESELSGETKPSVEDISEAFVERLEAVSIGDSEIQENESLTISSHNSEVVSPSSPASSNLQENAKDQSTVIRKSSDPKDNVATKNSNLSKTTRKNTDQPSDLTKKREVFTRKVSDLPTGTRNTESLFKKSFDQQTVSRFSEKPKVARTCSEQPGQSQTSSRNATSSMTPGKLSNKPGDLKTPPKSSESTSTTRKSPASSFVPTAKASDSLVAARKFAVQQQSAQKTTKPKKTPTFVRKIKNLQVLEGAAAKFEVLVDGNPTPTISWFKDGKAIPPELEKYRTESSDEGRCSLTIMSCGEDDDAEYGCKAINLLGSVVTKANLYVEPIGEELDNNVGAGRSHVK